MVAMLQYTDAQKLVVCMQRPSQAPNMSSLARTCMVHMVLTVGALYLLVFMWNWLW